MATDGKIKKGSSEDLLEVLRFIPRTYTIELSGYGGEVVIGAVSKETYEFFKENEIHVEHLAQDFDNNINIPASHRIFSHGAWHECDDLVHQFGVEFSSSGTVIVYDEDGNEIWTSPLEPTILRNRGCRADLQEVFNTKDQPADSAVFIGKTFEKGVFFSGEIQLVTPFNPKKLGFSYVSVDSWNVGSGVEYNDEYIENLDNQTIDKGHTYELIYVDDIIDIAPDAPISTYQAQDYEYSPEWPGDVNPVHTGWYECVYRLDGHMTTSGRLLWIGDAWMTYRYKKLTEVTNVKSWQGLNWDTSDMANRPNRRDE